LSGASKQFAFEIRLALLIALAVCARRLHRDRGIDGISLEPVAFKNSIISGHNVKSVENLLLPVRGIGPMVLWNYFILRGM
jgi:hypothetical protein